MEGDSFSSRPASSALLSLSPISPRCIDARSPTYLPLLRCRRCLLLLPLLLLHDPPSHPSSLHAAVRIRGFAPIRLPIAIWQKAKPALRRARGSSSFFRPSILPYLRSRPHPSTLSFCPSLPPSLYRLSHRPRVKQRRVLLRLLRADSLVELIVFHDVRKIESTVSLFGEARRRDAVNRRRGAGLYVKCVYQYCSNALRTSPVLRFLQIARYARLNQIFVKSLERDANT